MNKRLISGLLIASLISTQLPVMTLATNVLPENKTAEETNTVQSEKKITGETNISKNETTEDRNTVEPIEGEGVIIENTESLEDNLENDSSEAVIPEQPEDYSKAGVEVQEQQEVEIARTNSIPYAVEDGNIYFDPSTGTIVDADDSVTNVVIPESINDISVTTIGNSAFYECTNLKSIVLSNNITMIGNDAFYKCINLEEIILPNSLKTIGYGALAWCSSLESIVIPDGIATIEVHTFSMCTNLKEIVLPDSITTIGSCAFSDCSSLKEITLPNVTTLSIGIFSQCSSLENILLPNTIMTIEAQAFAGCSSLKEITIPDSVIAVGDYVFYNCTNLENITLSNSMTTIGEGMFSNCSNLKTMVLPNSITNTGRGIFKGCTNLENITLSNNMEHIEGLTFAECTKLKTITLPDSITAIGADAFSNCSNLEKINISKNITSIETYAFYKCTSLKEITLPNSIKRIGSNAFEQSGLESIIIPKSITIIESSVFYNTLLKDIYYEGNEEDWNKINIASEGNKGLQSAIIHYNSTTNKNYIIKVGIYDGWDIATSTIYVGKVAYTIDEDQSELRKKSEKLWNKCVVICLDNDKVVDIELLDDVIARGTIKDYLIRTGTYNSWDIITNTVYIDNIAYPINEKLVKINEEINNSFMKKEVVLFLNQENEIVYINIKTPTQKINILDVQDMWSFNNSENYFGEKAGNISEEGYILRGDPAIKLITKANEVLSETDKKRFRENLSYFKVIWFGSCHGMSVLMTLVKNREVTLQELGLAGSTISEVGLNQEPLNEHIQSIINFYHYQQILPIYSTMEENFIKLSQEEQLKKIEETIKQGEKQEKIALISIGLRYKNDKGENKKGGHAVIGYAIEEGKFKVSIDNVEYEFDHRILIYDPNDKGKEQGYFNNAIYYKKDDTNSLWALPRYSIVSKNNDLEISSKDNTGQLKGIAIDSKYLNILDYASSQVPPLIVSYLSPKLDTNIPNYRIKGPLGTEFNFIDGLFDGENTHYNNEAFILYNDDINYNDDEFYTVILPEINDDYTITTENENINFNMSYSNYYLQAKSDKSGTVNFNQNGKVELTTKENGTSKIGVTSNNSPLPWYTVEVKNEDMKELSAEWTDQGVVIAGDELKNVKVIGSNDEEEKELNFSTDKESILITTNEQETELIALIDTNNDGTYDTPIDKIPEDTIPTEMKKGSSTVSNSYPRNDIEVIASTGGTVKSNTTHTTKGTDVSLTVKPDVGYTLDTITVTDKEGNTIKVTQKETNLYQFTMPDCNVEVSATFKEVTKETPAQQQTTNATTLPFTDVPDNAWYRNAVTYVYNKGMMSGDGKETIFNPNGTTNRAMIVTILYRLEGEPQAKAASFSDIADNTWYTKAVNWAAENNIVSGYKNNKFGPKDAITREQLASILYRYAMYKGYDVTDKTDLILYVDYQKVSDYAKAPIEWIVANDVMGGMDESHLSPQSYATRAQVATTLMNFDTIIK